jgi:hypothetical protein
LLEVLTAVIEHVGHGRAQVVSDVFAQEHDANNARSRSEVRAVGHTRCSLNRMRKYLLTHGHQPMPDSGCGGLAKLARA